MDFCQECKAQVIVVQDRASGDVVCTQCGLVLESRMIDETPEYRNFADSASNPERVGAAMNPLLGDANLFTQISKDAGGAAAISSIRNAGGAASASDRALVEAFKNIENMADNLELGPQLVAEAQEMFKRAREHLKSLKGRNLQAILAACLYLNCKGRCSLREFEQRLSLSKNLIGRAIKDLNKINVVDADTAAAEAVAANVAALTATTVAAAAAAAAGNTTASAPVPVPVVPEPTAAWATTTNLRRYFSKLGVAEERSFKLTKLASEACNRIEKDLDIRKSPTSITAAVTYLVLQLDGTKKFTPGQVSQVYLIAEATLRSTCNELRPHLKQIFPGMPRFNF